MIYRLIKKMDTKNKLGKRIISGLITDEKRRKLDKYLKDKSRTRMIRKVSDAKASCLEDIVHASLKHISPIATPLALISQVPYSGGSLLNRLFDGHPEIHALPHELMTGPLETGLWPEIDLGNKPENWFKSLFKEIDIAGIQERFRHGEKSSATVPFLFLPFVQEQIFLKYIESMDPITQRSVFDAYITSCFGAWLDYQNLSGNKKFTTACAPVLPTRQESLAIFFELYPEGKIISLVKKPKVWFACASAQDPGNYGNAGEASNRWKESVQAVVEINRKFGDRVCLIKFEDLVSNRESVMRYLAEFLKISYENSLLTPTFNRIPLQPSNGQKTDNSNAKLQSFTESKTLVEDQRVLIEKMTAADYQSALQHVVAF